MLKIRKRTNNRKLRWGVAGLGSFSEQSVIPNLLLIRKIKLESVFSHSPQRAKAIASKFFIPANYSDYGEFLKSNIDAVYIGSRNSDHYEQVILAAKAGKHILCDKPLSVTAEEAEEMVRVCRENNVQFAVNFVYRFHPLTIKLKEILDSGLIGSLINIQGQFATNFLPGDNFRYDKKLGGGAMLDLAPHVLDLFRFLGGEIMEINGCVENLVYKVGVDDFAAGIVKFEKGHYGYFNVAFCVPRAFNRLEITGTRGSVSIDNLIAGKFPHSAKMTIILEGETKKAFRKRGNKLHRLIKSVNTSFIKNQTPLVTGNDGLVVMRLMEELERKCLSGRK